MCAISGCGGNESTAPVLPQYGTEIGKISSADNSVSYADETKNENGFYLQERENPSSDDLNGALDYIATLAQYTKTLRDVFLFTDKNNYSDTAIAEDMYRIFSDGTVGFAYSEDIYRADFERYLMGSITLDEFITEADRKLSTYLNE